MIQSRLTSDWSTGTLGLELTAAGGFTTMIFGSTLEISTPKSSLFLNAPDLATFTSDVVLIDYDGVLTGTFGTVDYGNFACKAELQYDAANTRIVLAAIPEPSAFALLGLSAIGLFARRRR